MTKNYMKWLLAAAVAVGLAVWLIWPVENEPKQGHNKGTVWLTDQERAAMKNAMRERLDTARLLTYVYGDSLMTVHYPDFFEIQRGALEEANDASVFFVHNTDSGFIYLRATYMLNDQHWGTEELADMLASGGSAVYGDSILLKDLHPGYFYLKILHQQEDRGYTYQQHVVHEDTVYMLSLSYSANFRDEDVQRLIQLVHDWEPK